MQWSCPETARRALGLVLGLAALAGCGCGEASGRSPTTVREVPEVHEGQLVLPAGYAERAGVVVEPVRHDEVAQVVHVTGVLEFDAQRLAAVGSRVAGYVAAVDVIEGSKVEAGQVLGALVSAELGLAQADVVAMQARAQAARLDVNRKRSLLGAGIASQREAELARSTLSIADAQLRAARQRVTALTGADSGRELGVSVMTSPIAGEVVAVSVSRGQVVDPGHTAFMIADRRTLWARLAVFEEELRAVQVGDTVELSVATRPDAVFKGEVQFVSAALDPATGHAEVRVVVDNESGELRAGQAVQANIRPATTRRRALVVPHNAVIQIDGAPTVFVALSDRAFEARQVTLGVGDPERVEITAGLAADERIAVAGVFALKGEMFR